MLRSLVSTAIILACQSLGSPLTTPNNSLLETRRDNNWNRREVCPDKKFGVDLRAIYHDEGNYWGYYLQWKGQCGCDSFGSSEDGCANFDICTGHHSVCLDWRSGRGHWIDPAGKRTCYSLAQGMIQEHPFKIWESWPTAIVPCTW